MATTLLRLILIVTGTILAAAPTLAQQIQGQVRYAESNQPAINTTVRCDGIGGMSIQMTDGNGKFFFRVSPGHYTVTVHIPGYKEEQQSADLTDTNSNEYFFFKLKSDGAPRVASPSVIDAAVPPKARDEFDKGAASIAEGRKETTQQGVMHLQKAISIYPSYVEAQLMLGATYMDLQEWDKAEQVLKKALEINPKAANAMFALGELYLHQKKDEEAEKILVQGLQIEDRSFQAHLTLGRVYWDMGAKVKEEAKWRPYLEHSYEQAKRALELNPNLAAAHLLKGNLMLRVGRAADAQKEFETYLQLEPNGPLADQTRAILEKIKKTLAAQKP
jgi:tetratricopeptide (TPR) repeat protein